MEEIIKKYKDEYGFVKEILVLYKDLTKEIDNKEALKIIEGISAASSTRISELKKMNSELSKIANVKKEEYLEYTGLEQQVMKREDKTKEKNRINIDFYVHFIEENLDNDAFLLILPKNNDKESIDILNRILNYYSSKLELNEYFLVSETDKEEINNIENELVKYNYIFNKILEYKNGLKNISKSDEEKFKNEISYFMKGDVPYIYSDIKDDPKSFECIIKLIENMQVGKFKNIESFSHPVLRGLYEVKSYVDQVRIMFEISEGKYHIIMGFVSKKENNSIYQERLCNRYKLYKENKENVKSFGKDNSLRKLLKGESYE